MAKSIKQIEAEVLAKLESKGFGISATEFDEITELKGIEELMVLAAANFILQVQENLNRAGKIDTGTLASDIEKGEITNSGGVYSIDVGYPKDSKAAKYYDFVNKGVKGTRSDTPADSPYSFRSDMPGPSMTSAIAGWYRRHASYGRRETQKKNLSAVQRKRKKLSKMVDANKQLRSLAYATAINIKRRGLKKTGFFDKAVQSSFGPDFVKALAKITGKEIAINIKGNGNNNK
jgi:hypothetical protein